LDRRRRCFRPCVRRGRRAVAAVFWRCSRVGATRVPAWRLETLVFGAPRARRIADCSPIASAGAVFRRGRIAKPCLLSLQRRSDPIPRRRARAGHSYDRRAADLLRGRRRDASPRWKRLLRFDPVRPALRESRRGPNMITENHDRQLAPSRCRPGAERIVVEAGGVGLRGHDDCFLVRSMAGPPPRVFLRIVGSFECRRPARPFTFRFPRVKGDVLAIRTTCPRPARRTRFEHL